MVVELVDILVCLPYGDVGAQISSCSVKSVAQYELAVNFVTVELICNG